MIKPFITKLVHMKLLDHKGGFALEVGSGDGADAKSFEELGYKVTKFDKKEGTDLRDFNFEKEKFDFINCNNVLPFISDKKEVAVVLKKMADSLRPNGTLHFTLFGENDEWRTKPTMSFYTFDEANNLVDSLGLKCVSRSSDEYVGKTMAGDDKYWHIFRFVLVKVIHSH